MTFEPVLDTLKLCDISDEEYFGPKYSSYISNSRLKLIDPKEDGSPLTFFEGLSKHNIFTSSLEFGSAVHALFLQPDDFMLCDVVSKPTAKLGQMADALYPNYKHLTDDLIIAASNKVDYYKGKMNELKIDKVKTGCESYWRDRELFEKDYKGKETPIYLNSKDRNKVKQCITNLKKNREIKSIMHPDSILGEAISLNEQTLLLDVIARENDQECLLHLKAKLDNFTINPMDNEINMNDLKTTGHDVGVFSSDSWIKYHYYRQAAFYSWLLIMLSKKEYALDNPNLRSNFMLVSSIPPCECGVYKASVKDFKKGMKEFKELLTLVAHYTMYPNEIY